jgi:hypothetical protein
MLRRVRCNAACGADAGMGQGELQADIANLRQIGMVAAPVLWSEIYQVSVRWGRPGAIYLCAAAVQMLNLLLTRGLLFTDKSGRVSVRAQQSALVEKTRRWMTIDEERRRPA